MKYIITMAFLFLSATCFAQATIGAFRLPASDTVIHWYEGTSTLSEPFNIYDSILSLQKQVLDKLEIIQKQVETIKRLDILLNTDHSISNSEALKFIELIKLDASLYHSQQ